MQLFDFTDYQLYLKSSFSGTGEGRGKRAHLAEALNCQTSFLTQVFTQKAHLSLEHALKACEYLNFDEKESDYFMLLVQKGKAGNKKLEDYFQRKIKKIKQTRDQIDHRIKIKTDLSLEDQMTYYSVWYYAAIHIAASIPNINTAEKISKYLNLSPLITKNALSFLEAKGFVEFVNGAYIVGARRIHLKKGMPMLPRHHSNWRMKAIASIDQEKEHDLHYTAVLGISKTDAQLLREKLLKLLEEFEPVISKSPEETSVVLLLDLFGSGS
jgi:uncharacterized protein (TIGR02147 family)